MSIRSNTTKGFTLLELLVVISLVVLIMLGATSLFLTFLVGSSKSNALQLVKNEGQYALSRMEFFVRNAISIEPNSSEVTCAQNMSELVIKSLDGGTTAFFAEEDSDGVTKIASNSGIYLTSDQVEITDGPEFDCSQAEDGSQSYVTIRFTLRKGTPGLDQPQEIVEEEFTTSANVRSY